MAVTIGGNRREQRANEVQSEVATVLDEFQGVFEQPMGLPPPRSFDIRLC